MTAVERLDPSVQFMSSPKIIFGVLNSKKQISKLLKGSIAGLKNSDIISCNE